MGSRMANSSIVQLTFLNRWGGKRTPYQVLTLILIHIKPTLPHQRSLPQGTCHIKENDSPYCVTFAFRSFSRHGLVALKKKKEVL